MELLPVLVGLMQWGDSHMAPSGEGPVQIRSRASGKLVRAALVDEDGAEVSPRDMRIVPVNAQSPASDQ